MRELGEKAAGVCYPLLCEPFLVSKVWGGSRLAELFGKPLPKRGKLGEAWEVADLAEGCSTIADGPLAGKTLREAMGEHGEEIVGRAGVREFPLLVKFINAEDDLSIQVHPDEQACRELFPQERSKEECWIVVYADPGAYVLHGVVAGATIERLRKALEQRRIVELLRKVPVSVGDVIYTPAGTVHALCRGVVVLEIQEPSYTTFRLYDYDRLDDTGRPRELHVEQAFASLRIERQGPPKVVPHRHNYSWGSWEMIAEGYPFAIHRVVVEKTVRVAPAKPCANVVVCLSGSIVVECCGRQVVLEGGRTCIVPGCAGEYMLSPEKKSVVVISTPILEKTELAGSCSVSIGPA